MTWQTKWRRCYGRKSVLLIELLIPQQASAWSSSERPADRFSALRNPPASAGVGRARLYCLPQDPASSGLSVELDCLREQEVAALQRRRQ